MRCWRICWGEIEGGEVMWQLGWTGNKTLAKRTRRKKGSDFGLYTWSDLSLMLLMSRLLITGIRLRGAMVKDMKQSIVCCFKRWLRRCVNESNLFVSWIRFSATLYQQRTEHVLETFILMKCCWRWLASIVTKMYKKVVSLVKITWIFKLRTNEHWSMIIYELNLVLSCSRWSEEDLCSDFGAGKLQSNESMLTNAEGFIGKYDR